MSEHITHIAVAEDSARLAARDPAYSDLFREAAAQFPDALRLGSTTRSGDTFIFPLLTEWRGDWQRDDPRTEKLAYVIGWAGHLAADRTFKPTYRITDLAYYLRGFPGPTHATIYQDVASFEHVYAGGQREPFHPATLTHHLSGMPGAELFPVAAVEPLMAYELADRLARLKDFSALGAEGWEEHYGTLLSERQRFYVDVARYTEAAEQPAVGRLHQYLLAPNFYDPDDPLLRYTETLRAGDEPAEDLAAVLATPGDSLYAQSLVLGHSFFRAISDYFTGAITEEEGRERMRTFQPHAQPLDYYVEQAKNSSDD